MARLLPGTLERWLKTGELAAKARALPADATEADFARSLGITPDAWSCTRGRWKRQGRKLPTLVELRSETVGARVPKSPARPVWAGQALAEFDRNGGQDDGGQTFRRSDGVSGAENRSPVQNAPVVPEGHTLKGVSSWVVNGETRGQWIKTREDEADSRAAVIESIRNLARDWPTIPEATAPPQYADEDLLCVYPMGDPHIGMLACRAETGEEFSLEIAERNLYAAVDHLALLAPPAKRAVVATVGDTFHSDGLSNTTTKGTRVDVDSRTFKMIDVGVRVFRRLIERALDCHGDVDAKIVPGNHDALISIMLRVALQQFFANESRVHVDPSPEDFMWHRFGANLIGFNHGHRATADALMQAMAVDRATDWGETRHRRIYKGHLHHEITKEVPGCTVDTLNTLASSDDWHRRGGYRSTRHMRMDIFHREFGLVNRHIVGIEQLRATTTCSPGGEQ